MPAARPPPPAAGPGAYAARRWLPGPEGICRGCGDRPGGSGRAIGDELPRLGLTSQADIGLREIGTPGYVDGAVHPPSLDQVAAGVEVVDRGVVAAGREVIAAPCLKIVQAARRQQHGVGHRDAQIGRRLVETAHGRSSDDRAAERSTEEHPQLLAGSRLSARCASSRAAATVVRSLVARPVT